MHKLQVTTLYYTTLFRDCTSLNSSLSCCPETQHETMMVSSNLQHYCNIIHRMHNQSGTPWQQPSPSSTPIILSYGMAPAAWLHNSELNCSGNFNLNVTSNCLECSMSFHENTPAPSVAFSRIYRTPKTIEGVQCDRQSSDTAFLRM